MTPGLDTIESDRQTDRKRDRQLVRQGGSPEQSEEFEV